MKEFLSEQKVDFIEYNVEDDKEARQRMVAKSHHTIIPTVVVGEEVVLGFDAHRTSANRIEAHRVDAKSEE
ncbi:MAG: glutaredoxin, partial [Firmicutes bacterium]|nr:glutaredoxin [Bacillota bacterium]